MNFNQSAGATSYACTGKSKVNCDMWGWLSTRHVRQVNHYVKACNGFISVTKEPMVS